MTRSILNEETTEGAVSDNVMLSGLNIVGCDQANVSGMYATFLEPFLEGRTADAERGIEGIAPGRALIIGDNNDIANLTLSNPGHPEGRGYDAVTLGLGNDGAEINADEGDLVADLFLGCSDTVLVSLGGLDRVGSRIFLEKLANRLSLADVQTRPTLIGYVQQHQHMQRQHTGSTKAVRETQFMSNRLRRLNIRLMNGVRAIQDIPIELNLSVPNTVAMVQSSPKGRRDIANHVGAPYTKRILSEQNAPDCGIAYSGVNHGTLFNLSDLDPSRPKVVTVSKSRSLFGEIVPGNRKINATTKRFMRRLADARTERENEIKRTAASMALAEAMKAAEEKALKTRARQEAEAIVAARSPAKAAPRPQQKRVVARPSVHLRNLFIANGVANHINVATMVGGLAQYEDLTGLRVPMQSDQMIVEFVKKPEITALARTVRSIASRTNIYLYGVLAVASYKLASIDADKAAAFFRELNTRGAVDHKSCGQVLKRRLKGLTDGERTPHRVLDYIFQAWAAFSAGRCIERFVDNDEISVHHAEIVQIRNPGRAAA